MMASEFEMESIRKAPGKACLGTRLLVAVIAKSFVEILFICAVATLAAFAYFNPALRGDVDVVDAKHIEGWAYNPLAADERLEVQLFIDNRFVATTRADSSRDDLVRAGAIPDAHHGFSFTLNDKQFGRGRHRAWIYVVHKTPRDFRTLLLISNRKLIFEVAN